MKYDVIIVGAGVTGSLTARLLTLAGAHVLLAERNSDVASGTTKANSAIVHAGFDAEFGTMKASMNVSGCNKMPALAKELDVQYDNNGSLVCAFGADDEAALRILYDRGLANGVKKLEIIGQDQLRELEPYISPEATAALWAPTAGIICPWELAIAACEVAEVNGARIERCFRVDSINRNENNTIAVGGVYQNGSRAVFEADYVVNAAGLYADKVAKCAGDDLPFEIIPRRGEYLLLDREFGSQAKHTLFSVPSERGKGILVSPTVHGNLILGPNAVKVDKEDLATTNDGIAEIKKGAIRLIPSVNLRGTITSFSGIRPTPSSKDFYIKPSEKLPGLVHAAGIDSPGLAASPAIAEYIAKLLGDMGLKTEALQNPLTRPEFIRFNELSDSDKAKIIAGNSAYGKIVCRCETITEGEIVDAILRPVGARDLDAVKRRVRAGMGRCQGGFCSPRVTELLARELGLEMEDITKRGDGSKLVYKDTERAE